MTSSRKLSSRHVNAVSFRCSFCTNNDTAGYNGRMGKMKSRGDERVALPRILGHASEAAADNEPSALQLAEPGQAVVNVVSREDIPPNGGYGWICAACVFFINAHTWGINSVRRHVKLDQAGC